MPNLYTMDEDDFVNAVMSSHKISRDHSKDWRKEARTCFDMTAGHQWSEDDVEKLHDEGRPEITFNRIAPVVEAVAGTEISNRQGVTYVPREMGDSGVNELLTNAAKWVRDECDAEDEESDAFLDAVICGMGWTETHIEYDEDPDGKIMIDRTDPMGMYWDTSAKKSNLTDRRWQQNVKRFTYSEFEENWPGMAEKCGNPSELDDPENRDAHDIHDSTEAWKYKNDQSDANDDILLYHVLEHQWYEMEEYYRVSSGGRLLEFSPAKFSKLRDDLDERGIQYVKQRRRKYYRAFICGNMLLEREPIDFFLYNPITAKRDRNSNTWYGLVRAMIDPQRWANKFFSQILHIINVNSKGGVMAESDAFVDPRRAEEEWSSPDSVTLLNPGALSGQKIKEKDMAKYPTGLDRLLSFAVSSVRDVTGVNLEFLGLAERDQPGILEQQRKQAGLTILASLFNNLRHYRKAQGRLLLLFIQEYISDGRLIRIDSVNGPQYAPLIRQDENTRYDVIIDEAPTTPHQKESVFAMLMQMMPALQQIGVPFPKALLEHSPLPTALVQDWIKQMDAPPPPEQQQLQQIQLQQEAAKGQKDESVAKLNMAKIQEIIAKIGFEDEKVDTDRMRVDVEIQRLLLDRFKENNASDATSIDQLIAMLGQMKTEKQE